MSKSIKIRKGLDIKLKGEADRVLTTPELGPSFCIKPTDFHGLVPKMVKKEESSREISVNINQTDKPKS